MHAVTTFGKKLRSLMAERGMSLRGLAREVPCDPGGLSRISRDVDRPSREMAERLDTVLNAEGELVARLEAPTDTQRDRLRRGLDELLAAGAMTEAALDDWELSVLRHADASRSKPARLLLDDLTADIEDLRRAMERHRSASALRRLSRVAAQMSGLMCLGLIKLDDRASFRRWARTARVASQEAGDPLTYSWVLAQEAYGHFYAGDLRAAITVAEGAQQTGGVCVGAVLAAALEARAHAAYGPDRTAETLAALGRAKDMLNALPASDINTSAFGYSESQLRFHEGNALTYLGDTAAAWTAQQRALELCPPGDFMDRALTNLDRTLCLVRDGDTASALEYAAATVAALTEQQRAGIIARRGRAVLDALSRDQLALPAARQLREILTPPGREANRP